MSDQPLPGTIGSEHLLTLYQITLAMNSSLEFDDALENIMNSVMQVTKAERGVLMGLNDDTGEPEILVARGVTGEKLAREDAYSTTIVNQVLQTREPLLTNNAMHDTSINPGQSIIMRGLRAILCAPMLVQDRIVGIIYVDTSMRTGNFTESDRDLLSAVAGQAGVSLENARLYRVAVEKGRIERELQLARDLQENLLPEKMPEMAGYEVAAAWQSAREMAGDFYDVFKLNDDTLGVVMADVSDKGAGAAMFMAVARSMIRTHAFSGLSPFNTLYQTNDLILDDARSGMFVTVYHSIFHLNGESVHINAGHNPSLIYRARTKQTSYMSRGGRAIGWFPDNPLHEEKTRLEAGDVMVFYTDGVTESENMSGGFFGEERLAQCVLDSAHSSAQAILDHIINQVEVFRDGAPPFDDLTLLVVRYTG
ncbi:MAG: SpoIIE family protein phosphatase [Anaerolineaceae bacterium]|nr:SpoIIE family protein phosphatase [Anaerolineaceae bacterium]